MTMSSEDLARYWTEGAGAEAIGEPATGIYEYAAFNDDEVLAARYEDGSLPEAMRFVVDEPLVVGSLWSVARWARLVNEERARDGKMDESGPVVIKRRILVATSWGRVSYEEVNEALQI
jgi:hypothetical protein